jgi:hypothetical protein
MSQTSDFSNPSLHNCRTTSLEMQAMTNDAKKADQGQDALKLHTAASRLVAAIQYLFPDPKQHEADWEPTLPEKFATTLELANRGMWKDFVRKPSDAHSDIIQRQPGLKGMVDAI